MAGNRRVFEQAMRQGTNYAWDKQWNKAVAEYQRAIAEFPEEAPAYAALGQALVNAGRLNEALNVYQNAARLTPGDPLALARVAELQEQSGDMFGSIQTWLHIADLHLRRRDVDAAVQVWQHLVEVAPDTVGARERLAKAYGGMGQTRKAMRQYLALTAIYQRKGAGEQATAVCQEALKLDPHNPVVLSALEALKQGRSVGDLITEKPAGASYTALEKGSAEGEDVGSPVDMMRQKALVELASALLEESSIEGMEFTTALLQGIDFQTRGETGAAIECYEKGIHAGIRNHAALFSLGLLYQESLRFEDAIEQFRLVKDDVDYALGAHCALGECLRALGRLDEAVVHFIEVLRQVDLMAADPENAGELRQIYDALTQRYATVETRASVAAFINELVEFLCSGQWEDRVYDVRQRLDRLGSGRVISLAEILALPDSERILNSMVRAQEYYEAGMLRSASEEYLWAIEHAPNYLLLHLLLARLFRQGNQVGMAIDKYLFVADTFAAREEMDHARHLYEEVLLLAPMDLDVRQKLITLLQEHRMVEQALEHQLALADAHFELAQVEASREQYKDALRLVSQLADHKTWTARILHRLGDIDFQRLDWRSAIEVYLQLKDSVPEDERARQRLVELHFNLGHRAKAIAELDELIALYRRQANLPKGLEILEELIEGSSEELELHKRAAQLCVESGNIESAIAHLDTMGDLQLQAGHIQAATATIKAIIALGPESADAYRELLEHMS